MSSERRVGRSTSSRKKAITTATLLAIGGLASTYMQVLRPTAAYATACTTVTDETSLGLAIADVNAGTCDTITFADNASITLTADLAPINLSTLPGAQSLTVIGAGATIDGASAHRAFKITDDQIDSVSISDLTLTGMHSTNHGSAIAIYGINIVIPDMTNVDITDVTFTNDYSVYSGGAVHTTYTDLTMTGSVFEDNATHDSGGAMNLAKPGTITISDTTFGRAGADAHGNESWTKGGAIVIGDSPYVATKQISDSTFFGNTAGVMGGAIETESGLTVSRSTFDGNTTNGMGGAINSSYTPALLTIDSSSFTNNSAFYGGTAIYGFNTAVENSTFIANSGAVAVIASLSLDLSFSTLVGNTETSPSGATVHTVTNLTAKGSLIMGEGTWDACRADGTGSIDYVVASDNTCGPTSSTNSITNATDPDIKLSPLVHDDQGGSSRYPLSGSILISGAPSTDLGTGITTDQIGVVRGPGSASGLFDIGARQTGLAPSLTATPPSGVAGTDYAGYTLMATGTGPFAYTIDSGTLPPGLALDQATGVLSGIPTTVGRYSFTVRATSAFGTTTAPATIAIASPTPATAPPHRPLQPSVRAGHKPGTAVVTVTRGTGGGAPTRFRVTARVAGTTAPVTHCGITATDSGTCVLTGLKPGVKYAISATASNPDGTSQPSRATAFTLPAPKVPGAPSALHAMAMPDSAMLHWTDPVDNGGAKIRSFAVGFRLANVPEFTEYRTTKGHMITVGGLIPGCVYRFSVAATNAVGTGKPRISDPVRIPSPLRGDITCRLLS